jgi:hypothetical protein
MLLKHEVKAQTVNFQCFKTFIQFTKILVFSADFLTNKHGRVS